jgi:hypothetical protein
MGPLRELLAIDHRQALEFFVLRLQDVSGSTVDQQELLPVCWRTTLKSRRNRPWMCPLRDQPFLLPPPNPRRRGNSSSRKSRKTKSWASSTAPIRRTK